MFTITMATLPVLTLDKHKNVSVIVNRHTNKQPLIRINYLLPHTERGAYNLDGSVCVCYLCVCFSVPSLCSVR